MLMKLTPELLILNSKMYFLFEQKTLQVNLKKLNSLFFSLDVNNWLAIYKYFPKLQSKQVANFWDNFILVSVRVMNDLPGPTGNVQFLHRGLSPMKTLAKANCKVFFFYLFASKLCLTWIFCIKKISEV